MFLYPTGRVGDASVVSVALKENDYLNSEKFTLP